MGFNFGELFFYGGLFVILADGKCMNEPLKNNCWKFVVLAA